MNADDVWREVEAEIAGNWTLSNAHGVDLLRCVVRPPVLLDYLEIVPEDCRTDAEGRNIVGRWGRRQRKLWLVLQEYPSTREGYDIVYNADAHVFGLAHGDTSTDVKVVDGYYGSFLTTLDAM